MHRDVAQLRRFYSRTDLGMHASTMLGKSLRAIWPNARGMAVVGFGYPLPLLQAFRGEAAQTLALMPAEQGVVSWIDRNRNAAALVEGDRLPMASQTVDRLVSLHGIELASRPEELLQEIHRVLSPGGRVVVIVPNRTGLWARSDSVPFGLGQPFTVGQLRRMLRDYGFDPCLETAALYAPPSRRRFWIRSAPVLERAGARFAMRRLAGVLVVEAVKLVYVAPRPALAASLRGFVGAIEGIAAPAPSPAPGASRFGKRETAGAAPRSQGRPRRSNAESEAPPAGARGSA